MWDLIVSVPDHCLSFYYPLAFIIIRTVCCSERIKFLKKKNVIQLKRVCAITVIPVT